MGFLSSDGLDIKEIHRWLAVVWLMAGGPLILAALPVPAFEPLRKLFFPVVRRGKLLRMGESTGKGLQTLTVPQSFFTHFYVVGLIWTTALFFTSLAFAVTCSRPAPEEHSLGSLASQLVDGVRTDILGQSAVLDIGVYGQEAWRLVFVLLLFQIHLTRRLYECLFVSAFDPSARMNFLGYITAIGYYTAVPFTLFLQCFHDEGFIKAFKGFLKQTVLKHGLHVIDTPSSWDIVYFLGRFGWMQYLGAAVCFYSSFHQHRCHEILALLRDDDGGPRPPSSYVYGIPRGDWFEFVSCPHYLAEIALHVGTTFESSSVSVVENNEGSNDHILDLNRGLGRLQPEPMNNFLAWNWQGFYAGLLIAGGANSTVLWILFISVVANLYLVAKPTHEWYLSKFEDYPKTRRALFPSFRQIRAKN